MYFPRLFTQVSAKAEISVRKRRISQFVTKIYYLLLTDRETAEVFQNGLAIWQMYVCDG